MCLRMMTPASLIPSSAARIVSTTPSATSKYLESRRAGTASSHVVHGVAWRRGLSVLNAEYRQGVLGGTATRVPVTYLSAQKPHVSSTGTMSSSGIPCTHRSGHASAPKEFIDAPAKASLDSCTHRSGHASAPKEFIDAPAKASKKQFFYLVFLLTTY